MITTYDSLCNLVSKARKTDAVAVDTEFVWKSTYTPQLGLIQLALSDEDCHLIDPIAIEDLSPFGELLADRRVVKIFHDAPQDLAILKNATGYTPKNIFDTRLAAGFAGLPATLSLGNLISELLDISLPKTETRTNWLQRPLAKKQKSYALDDVRYLRAARIVLVGRIIGPEIKAWLQEELNILNHPKNYIGVSDHRRYTRIRGAKSLSSASLVILRELSAWRERTARRLNKPRGHILQDKILLEISKRKPESLDDLKEIVSLSQKHIDRWGSRILAATATALALPKEKQPIQIRETRLNKQNKQTLEHLGKFIQLKSQMQGIDPSLIGNTSELKKLIKILNTSCPSRLVRQMEGWRKIFLRDFFRYTAAHYPSPQQTITCRTD